MKKQDYIGLIEVVEAVMRLEEGLRILSGKTFEEGDGAAIYSLWDILRRNAAERFHYNDNLDIDIKNHNAFMEILDSEDMTPEEKYEALMA